MQKGETDQLRGELSAIRKLEELELLEWVTSADQLAGMSVVGLREMRARLEKHAAALAEAIPRCVCRLSDPLPLLPAQLLWLEDDGCAGRRRRRRRRSSACWRWWIRLACRPPKRRRVEKVKLKMNSPLACTLVHLQLAAAMACSRM